LFSSGIFDTKMQQYTFLISIDLYSEWEYIEIDERKTEMSEFITTIEYLEALNSGYG